MTGANRVGCGGFGKVLQISYLITPVAFVQATCRVFSHVKPDRLFLFMAKKAFSPGVQLLSQTSSSLTMRTLTLDVYTVVSLSVTYG